MKKEDLIDFGIYVDKNDIILENGNITETVDAYLKSLESSSQHETSKVITNEKAKEELHYCLIDNSCKSYGTSKCTPKCKLYV